MDNTNIPVLGHADGICHAYVHEDADIASAVNIVVDSKTQYVAVCNALETLLVHEGIAAALLPALQAALEAKGVALRGCERTREIIDIDAASESDWSAEYLDLVLSIRIVGNLGEAVGHINRYGSHHTDTILTADRDIAERFMVLVDSANVMWNCSTRFADGYRFGLGAEVGIGTGKIHARGPVGMEGLLIYKWKLYGSGQVVADYTGPNAKSFSHKPISDG
jgi:glutamate-5-semialdehyde dehydrogenase